MKIELAVIVVFFMAMIMPTVGCSTSIDKDTKLSLKGPKAELSRKF